MALKDSSLMALDDPRGGQVSEMSHEVRSLAKAREWYVGAIPSQLPLRIEQAKTSGGRMHVEIYAASGKLLETRG